MSTAHDVPMRVTGLAPRGADSSVRDDGALVYRPPRGRLCSEREPQLQRNVPDAEHRSLAMTAIFFAEPFLEALVNEVILDVAEPPPGGPSARVAGIPVDAKRGARSRACGRTSAGSRAARSASIRRRSTSWASGGTTRPDSRSRAHSWCSTSATTSCTSNRKPRTSTPSTTSRRRSREPKSLRTNNRSARPGSRMRRSALG